MMVPRSTGRILFGNVILLVALALQFSPVVSADNLDGRRSGLPANLEVIDTGQIRFDAQAAPGTSAGTNVDPGCEAYGAWTTQANPRTDVTSTKNHNFPEGSDTTYFNTELPVSPLGSVVTIAGRYPRARYVSLQVYIGDVVLDVVTDTDIQPDPGENNPFVSGTEQGTFTAYLIYGPKPSAPASNTIYTLGHTNVRLVYRLYHTTDPDSPEGEAYDPVLPDVWLNGAYLPSCPPRPVIDPEDLSPWGRLDNGDWIGTLPTPELQIPAQNPPQWWIQDPWGTHYFPNADNYYFATMLSREFLSPHTDDDLFVLRFKAPSFPATRAGQPVWLNRQVRFWSVCTDDPYTTNVNRCVPDSDALIDGYGFATFVISDPGGKPSDAALAEHHARWVPWGALASADDVMTDRQFQPWGVDTPLHYYNLVLYRQTSAQDWFVRSMANIWQYPESQQRALMGPYWPVSGYCSTEDFEDDGVACILP